MAEIIEITDIEDHALDIFARLTEAQLRSRVEEEKGIFIAESPGVIEIALDKGYTPISLLMEKRHLEGKGKRIIEKCGDIVTYTAEREVLTEIIGYPLTRGILCAMRRPRLLSVEKVCSAASRIAVMEDIVDTTNVGAIFRSAAALGIDGILISPSCCDPLSRRTVRVSMGTVFQVPWTYIGESAEDWYENGPDKLKGLGFKTVAMALSNNSVSIEDESLKKEKKLAIILGTEGTGLKEKTISNCDVTAKIPMYHGVDSLNVAAASAVAFWELRKKDL